MVLAEQHTTRARVPLSIRGAFGALDVSQQAQQASLRFFRGPTLL
jgi:hypothetical protein